MEKEERLKEKRNTQICLDVLEDFVFEEPREFSLKQIQEEVHKRGGNYDSLERELIDFQSRGIINYINSKNKYFPKSLTGKK